ncbi:translocation/assembly module TamB domain-containing protein, partial [Vibrio sp. Y176]|uniref:translocation/assembly module TamB domain-containing protein n=1 Tax=Vibrio sp. Y176 TaxID=3074704 RepID=UPI002965C1CB
PLVLGCAIALGSTYAMAEAVDLKQNMKQMKMEFKQAAEASDVETMKSAIDSLQAIVEQSKRGNYPPEKFDTYLEGFKKLSVTLDKIQADLDAGIITPDGKLEITGDADWRDLQDWRTRARVFAKELKVDMPPMVKIKVEPDMTIDVTPQLAKVEGNINLPWGRIVIEELPPSAVGVSSDTVILNKDLQPVDEVTAMPFNVETDINIKIGDDFQLAAFGLKGGLKGSLNVTQKDKGPFIVGEVNIVDGSYRSFGQDLVIEEGKILMNGPADQPYVSIKAIRNPDNTQDDVIAGVRVTGPASDPSVEIFSEPA